jgi:hypothetical protein
MAESKRGQRAVVLPMLLAALLHDAGAQTSATVVVTAPRPADLEAYRATEARIRNRLSHQPSPSSPFLRWCMENRFARENAAFPGGPLPSQDSTTLALHVKCGRTHIEAKDTSLRQGLDAFDKRDYAAALEFFQEAYSKMGILDAALMLAKMHLDGLGTPKDRVQGIKWLRETAEATSKEPQAQDARDEAAMMLARMDELDEGAAQPLQADTAAGAIVRVTGLRAIPWKSYRALRAAVAAFETYNSLAPDAVFGFAVLPPVGKTLPPNFALRVRTRDGREFPVPVERGELFQLPALPDPEVDADLVSNLKEGPLRIGLLVHTPSVPADKERLGDVRLRAEISQAIADVDHPRDDPECLSKRLLLPRRCRPAHVSIWYKPRAPASGAWVVEGSRREALAGNGDPAYPAFKMPVNAGHLGNDAIIEFDYKNPPGPVKYASVAIYDAND